jgi:hypothetical protein
MTEHPRDLLVCTAALLDQGRTVDRLSRPLTAAALVVILICSPVVGLASWVPIRFAMLVALAGIAETYFAIRVGFDATLFRQVASAPEAPDFAATDAALARLGVRQLSKLGRTADARVEGAKRLFGFQILSLVVQVVPVLAAGSIALR